MASWKSLRESCHRKGETLLNYIILENVEFSYPKQKKIINNMSIEFYLNDFTAIVGPNGSGKTTLGKLMTGILKPQKGRVLLDNLDSSKMSLGAIGRKVGYLFQNPERQIFAPNVYEELAFPLELKGQDKKTIEKKVEEALTTFHLAHLTKSFPFILSQGEKQRLVLASIFINEPKFLVLDEPTTGLDIERKRNLSNILEALKEKGVGIVTISHDESFIKEHATRVIEIVGGEIVSDSKKSLGSKSKISHCS